MDKNKVIKLLIELLNELAPGTVSENPQPGEITIGTRGDIQKILEDIKAQEAQIPPEPRKPTEKDILKEIERKMQEEKYRKGQDNNTPSWTMIG